jgi:predicted DNA-binding transcriptional regulator AlpA
MPEILTVEELARLLKMSKNQVYSMLRRRGTERMSNPLPRLNLNGNLRFRRLDIEAWLERCAKEDQ